MRGEEFTVEARGTDRGAADSTQPGFRIIYGGQLEELKRIFRGPGEEGYSPPDLDFFYRHLESAHPAATSGKFGVADRANGAYLFEARVHPSVIEVVVRGVGASDRCSRYRVELRTERGRVAVFEKEILLVYDASGSLLRERSLIPGHVEI